MSGWARWVRLAGILGLMLALYFTVPASDQARGGTLLRAALAVVGLVALAIVLVVQLRRHLDDLDRRIDGLLAAIVLVVVAFSFGFYLLGLHQPGQLVGVETRVDALYFTMSTMTSVGYGDVHAVGQAARILVLVQMAFNLVFVAASAALVPGSDQESGRYPGQEPVGPGRAILELNCRDQCCVWLYAAACCSTVHAGLQMICVPYSERVRISPTSASLSSIGFPRILLACWAAETSGVISDWSSP